MRNKKLLSTVVASALVATTMAMPVMAADGGQVDVDVDTKTAVIRVEVPTSLVVAVNQFEKDDAGSQIYSTDFGIKNKSEIPVQMTVDSELKMASTVKLAGTKAAVESSEEANGEAWLAVAAQTSAGKYIEEANKTIKDLTEESGNVATFVQDETTKTKATAQQVFYLDKAASVSSLTYTTFVPKENAKADVAYAQFYKLTPVSFTAAADPQNPTSDEEAKWQKELETAVAAGDVYEIATSVDTADTSGKPLTIYAKGSKPTYAATNTYYSVATTPTAEADLKTTEKYMYTETAEGGNAAFRYIGSLSESKPTWTDTDFEKVTIKYDIVGTTTTKYDSVKDDCTYGLYCKDADQVTLSATGLITLNVLGSDIKSLAVNDGEADYEMNSTRGTWEVYDEEASVQKFQLGDDWVDYLKGKSAKAVLTLQDDTTVESKVVAFPE